MANSKYEYVRTFERDEILLPQTWIVIRIDGRGFHKLSTHYTFTKPNDRAALDLMNRAAISVFRSVPDLCIAYGVSDEYSFVFHKSTTLFERRREKLISTVVSAFTAAYVFLWNEVMTMTKTTEKEGRKELEEEWLPTFDARAVVYPDVKCLRDYLSWRQVDCHINNLYNTTFWAMVQQGNMSATAAEEELKGTFAADKNEILYSRFGVNYNNEPEMFRKGSVVFREYALEDDDGGGGVDSAKGIMGVNGSTIASESTDAASAAKPLASGITGMEAEEQDENVELLSKTQQEKIKKARQKARIVVRHVDIIKDDFWRKRPWILSGKPGRPVASQSN